MAFPSEHKHKNWYAIVPFPCKQPICPFQKLEQRWNGTIALPCELGLKLTKWDFVDSIICSAFLSAKKMHKCKYDQRFCEKQAPEQNMSDYNNLNWSKLMLTLARYTFEAHKESTK